MKRLILVLITALISMGIATGCSESNIDPISPRPNQGTADPVSESSSGTHLWGYYNISLNPESSTAEIIPARNTMFTANVVNFLNNNPVNLKITIINIDPQPGYTDFILDVYIRHPFPGMPQYNGYDVRGVFMGNGSSTMEYNPDLQYPDFDLDQSMLPDPWNSLPDGYTRWFNLSEFSEGGMPLFQYTKGNAASPGFSGTATLNPYRYFADGLGPTESLWAWLENNPETNGVFTSGTTNSREYNLRFPDTTGIEFAYAVIANWEGIEEKYHPANAPEAVALKITDNSDLYFLAPDDFGGDLDLDISVWNWNSELTSVVMEDYSIILESTVLSSPNSLTPAEMTPIGGGENYSTFHVEIPADNITGTDDQEAWVIIEQNGFDYTNEFGVPNHADTDPLAAFFKFGLDVSDTVQNSDPVCALQVVPDTEKGWDTIGAKVEFDTSGTYDPDGDELTWHWDFDGDDIYDEPVDDEYNGDPWQPVHVYMEDGVAKLHVEDGKGGEAYCEVVVDVTLYQSKNIELRPTSQQDPAWAVDLALDHVNGDLYVLYNTGPIGLRTAAGFYQKDDEVTWKDVGPMAIWVDVSGDQNVHVSFTGLYFKLYHYQPDGTVITNSSINLWGMEEQFAFSYGSGPYANDVFMTYGEEEYNVYSTTWFYHYQDTTYDFLGNTSHTVYYPDFFGCDRIKYQNISGIETDQDNEHIWICEGDDFARFSLDVPSGTISQDGPCISEGGRDITRDDQNHIFVLDYPNSIRMYDGSTGDYIGVFGDNTTMAGGPARALEGSDYNGNIFVVHGTPDEIYRLSIFFPEEMPG